jgi:hypothetical protein
MTVVRGYKGYEQPFWVFGGILHVAVVGELVQTNLTTPIPLIARPIRKNELLVARFSEGISDKSRAVNPVYL